MSQKDEYKNDLIFKLEEVQRTIHEYADNYANGDEDLHGYGGNNT